MAEEIKKVTNSITIHAPMETVWKVLTHPEETRKYMFGCATESDWQPGSLLLWKGNYEGKEMVFVKGYILDIEKNKRLRYTVFDPNSDMPDIPENYLNVQYTLETAEGGTLLTVTQDGFEQAANGEKRYQEVNNNGEGWNPVLVMIKSVAETGKAG